MIKGNGIRIDSIFNLIIQYRYKADWTFHEYSSSEAGDPIPCTDEEVLSFLSELKQAHEEKRPIQLELVISGIEWEKHGNCTGDELYPVILSAVSLPDGRHYIQIKGLFEMKEYVYDPFTR